jgi:hypothetical protein
MSDFENMVENLALLNIDSSNKIKKFIAMEKPILDSSHKCNSRIHAALRST